MDERYGELISELHKIKSLLVLFGERYINTDDEQALLDAQCNRDNLVCAFNAIVDLCEAAL
ncbi:MAG: hypothetical protein MJ000_11075 [Bacteroidales bacterium]|nr:hypothetical protein [Bacteroidales bacterium]